MGGCLRYFFSVICPRTFETLASLTDFRSWADGEDSCGTHKNIEMFIVFEERSVYERVSVVPWIHG